MGRTDAGLEDLWGLPITSIFLYKSRWGAEPKLSAACLGPVMAMPLRRLSLAHCQWLTDAGLDELQHLPLTSLDIWSCNRLTNSVLEVLQNLPLTALGIRCEWLKDSGMEQLRGLQLTELDLYGCHQISDLGVWCLADMPLTSLNLGFCSGLTDGSLDVLWGGLPLARLNVANSGLSRGGKQRVAYLQEKWNWHQGGYK